MSAPLLLPCSPPPQLRKASSDRSSRAAPLIHIGSLGAYGGCQNSSPKAPLLKNNNNRWPLRCSTPSEPAFIPTSESGFIPTKESSVLETNTTSVVYCRETSPSRCRLLPPSTEVSRTELVSNPLTEFRSGDISPSRKAFLPSRVSPLKGYSSESISSLSPLSPLSPHSPTFPHRVPFTSVSSLNSSKPCLKKSQSALIMPSLLTFFRSDSLPPTETSSRSLNEATQCPSPLMRKCHTMIALSNQGGGSNPPVTTKLANQKKRFTLLRRISPSKSATFAPNKLSSSSSLPEAPYQGASIPRSPSASVALHKPSASVGLQKHQQRKSTLMWPHPEHPDESELEAPALNRSVDFDEEKMFGSGTVGSCSRCASAGSLTSKRHSAVFSDGVFCKLCLTDVSVRETYQLQQCQCRFCTYCMCMYTTLKIREGEPYIDCPDSNCDCNGELTLEEVESLVGKELLSLHLKFRRDREVDLDPLKTWCPRPGCNTVVSLSVSKMDGRPQCSSCSTCNTCFCATCSYSWHPGKPCHKTAGQIDVPLNEAIKRCPRCKVPIERDAGCAQMQCKKCKHVFCWYCLASLEDDFLLRHYDKGPCKNKLGHSRASVLLHRAQVVVIFAGFGLLLVIASPILLFVGPCLLCRSCRACTKSETDDDTSSSI